MCKYCDNYRKNDVAKHINDYGFYITFDEEKNQVDLYVQADDPYEIAHVYIKYCPFCDKKIE